MANSTLAYNDGQIYYEVTGSGESIVFIHGFTLDHTMWQPQIAAFSKTYQVITYDARGFGRSSLPNSRYNHVDDLHALLNHLDIKQAYIVGLSMGGRIATNFTLSHPDKVKSLTLMASALDGYANEVDWNVYAREEGLQQARKNWLNHEIFTATRAQPKILNNLRTIIGDYSGWHWLNSDMQEPANTHARERLKEITKPTLIIVGGNDLAYFHNIANVLAAGIKNARMITVLDAGHMVNMEASDRVNDMLAHFITNSRSFRSKVKKL
jgi:pimeloyl-ACP methyl ester carboxylesterase